MKHFGVSHAERRTENKERSEDVHTGRNSDDESSTGKTFEENGWDKLPICVAKTQYSLSDNAKLLGRPHGFTVTVREFKPSIGAGFIVALMGDIMTMPGLPKVPSSNAMDVIDDKIVGLF